MKSGSRGARNAETRTPRTFKNMFAFPRLTIERFKSCDFNRRIKYAFQQIVVC